MNSESSRRQTLSRLGTLSGDEKKFTARKGFYLDSSSQLKCYKCGQTFSLNATNHIDLIDAHQCSGTVRTSGSSQMFANSGSPKNSASSVSRRTATVTYPVKTVVAYSKSPNASSQQPSSTVQRVPSKTAVSVQKIQQPYSRKINVEYVEERIDDVIERRCNYHEVYRRNKY